MVKKKGGPMGRQEAALKDKRKSAGPSAGKARSDPILPLHHQLYNALYQKIQDGSYGAGSPFPGELRIAQDFRVSRTTVRRAMERLQREGLISRHRGAGTFARQAKSQPPAHSAASYAEYLGEVSQAYQCDVLEFAYVPTPTFLDDSENGYGPVVLKIVRLSKALALPVHLSTTYIPQRFGQEVPKAGIGSQPIVSMLRKSGVKVEHASLTIEAIAADALQADLLHVAIGAPILRGTHVSHGVDDMPIEFNVVVSRPEHFRYRFVSDEESGSMTPAIGLI